MSSSLRLSLLKPVFLAALALILVGASSTAADAQHRRPIRQRSVVIVRSPVYPAYPYFGWYSDPWFQRGYPWGPWAPYGYGRAVPDVLTSSIRLAVSPNDAEVFVDGYRAGTVDDFDGIFQRLRLRPGPHQVAIYLEGYRTILEDFYLNPDSDQKVAYQMEPLAAGETSEPPPAAGQPPSSPDALSTPEDATPNVPARPSQPAARFGTLSIRVQPAAAEVFVDDELWSAPAGQDRLAIRLAIGRHHVEVRQAGFAAYAEDILIRDNSTLTLNVSLLPGDE